MKRQLMLSLVIGLFAGASYLAAQVPNEGLAMKIVAARKANAAKMQQYTWNCRTELIKNGTTEDIRIDQVQYGPDGNIQRTLLNNESFFHPKGFLFRKMAAEDKKKELEKYLKGMRDLLDQYTLPTAGKVLDFMSAANVQFVQAPDGASLLMMQGNNVIVPGDTMSIWATPSTNALRKVQVNTSFEGSTAEVTGTFKTSKSGLTFMSLAEVDVSDKGITLLIHNYDYESND